MKNEVTSDSVKMNQIKKGLQITEILMYWTSRRQMFKGSAVFLRRSKLTNSTFCKKAKSPSHSIWL